MLDAWIQPSSHPDGLEDTHKARCYLMTASYADLRPSAAAQACSLLTSDFGVAIACKQIIMHVFCI